MPIPRDSTVVNGHALRVIRTLRGMSGPRLAAAVGCDYSNLARVERGERASVRPEVFAGLISVLEVDPRALMANPQVSNTRAA